MRPNTKTRDFYKTKPGFGEGARKTKKAAKKRQKNGDKKRLTP
jgi:hypothetical protein